jgi:hypothetical protein
MNRKEFKSSLVQDHPPAGLNPCLLALWLDAKGDWEGSHRTVQDISGMEAARVHAYLHRKEGDQSNAGYWYSRAGRSMPGLTLEKEWEEILSEWLPQ